MPDPKGTLLTEAMSFGVLLQETKLAKANAQHYPAANRQTNCLKRIFGNRHQPQRRQPAILPRAICLASLTLPELAAPVLFSRYASSGT